MKVGQIYLKNSILESLLAISELEQRQGLMGQKWKPPNMTFLYTKPKINTFWMYNTPSPLDIIFCRDNKIKLIARGEPYSTSSIGHNLLSDLVIELPYTTARDLNLRVGDSAGLIDFDF